MIQASLTRSLSKKYPEKKDADAQVSRIMENIQTSTNLADACSASDLIVEAIVENMAMKHSLFKTIECSSPKNAILASNTSSLSIAEIAKVTSRTSNFVGLHFFNPVPQMKLVEVISLDSTSNDVKQSILEFCKNIGKTPVMCQDTPGFIVNRLLVPYMMEAIRLVERGEATKEDVDIAMKLGAGYPMGPFELLDYVGLDTCKFITDGWYRGGPLKGDKIVAPNELLDDLVKEKKFGRKSGSGFYDYKKK